MNPLHALQIVNDLTLSMLGENEVAGLTRGVLQRLLYHTGFPVGVLLERAPGADPGAPLRLVQALGNRDLALQIGRSVPWIEGLALGASALLSEVVLDDAAFAGASRYHHGLRLEVGEGGLVFILLGPTAPVQGVDIGALFTPLLPRFARLYRQGREREADIQRLNGEIESRMRMEQSLRASEERLMRLLEHSPQAVALLDLGSNAPVLVNARLRAVLGWELSELGDAHTWMRLLFPDQERRRHLRDELAHRVARAKEQGGALQPFEAQITCRDGHARPFEVHAHVVGAQAIVHFVDLSEHLARRDELRAAKEQAERASAAKSLFLSSVSHELRTPLNAILGFAQLLDSDERLLDALRGHAREILESGYHLLALVDDVLDLTRIESGRMAVSIGAVPLDLLVRESAALVESQAAAAEVTVEKSGIERVRVAGDATRLRQVLINLMSNGIKYNTPGGRVTVDVELVAAARCRVSVSDTGPGIAPARLSGLFQPFNRLGAEGGLIEGTGIGLVVAKQLVELMGGCLGVDSQLGQGSTFWFELPLASDAMPEPPLRPALRPGPRTVSRERTTEPAMAAVNPPPLPTAPMVPAAPVAAAQAPASPPPLPEPQTRRARVLIVEDHPMNQRLMRLQLDEIGGFDIVVAGHGAQALERWQEGGVDLILTDCNMPIMDGYELATTVRECERGTSKHVPIVAVSASAMKEDVDRCLASGMDETLAKPLMVGAMAEAIERWLPGRVRVTTARHDPPSRTFDRRRPYRRALEAMLPSGASQEVDALLEDFLRSGSDSVAQGRQALDGARVEDVGRAAHKIRPSAKLVGAHVLAAHAQTVEAAARANDHATVGEVWPLLESAWERVRVDLTPPPPPTRPVAKPTPTRISSNDAARPRDRVGLRGLRTLVIDDDPFTAKYVSEQLTRMGMARVQLAEDGRRGLERIRESGAEIDLVICDLAMPGMDGIELLRNLTAHEFRGSLVFMSGAGSRVLGSVDELARQHGFNVLGTLAKPFGAEALGELLNQHRPAMARRSRDTRMLQVGADELERAIKHGDINVHLQPKVLASSLEVVGVEALARWQRSDGTMIPPITFVRIAEANDLADALFDAVFEKALRAGQRLEAAGFPLKVAINVSAQSLARVDFAERIFDNARALGSEPSSFLLEVTETGLVRDLRVALDVLTRLRLHDIGLSIDDFGTGYSSIDLLRRVPFTELKIDRSFVGASLRDPSARHIIASSLAMARGLGLTTVAEGVETEGELELMRELGCDLVQGYLIAKPMPESQLEPWLRARLPHG